MAMNLGFGPPPVLPYDPTKASGQTYNPATGKWDFVAAGGSPQQVYYGPTNQQYQNNQPVPYDPSQAAGESYDPGSGKWKAVAAGSNPDLVYDAKSDTAYYKGQPLSQSQLSQLKSQGPEATGNYFTQQPIDQGLKNLKFGQATTPITAPTINPSGAPTFTGAVPTAGQAAAPGAAVGGMPTGAVPTGVTPTAGSATAAQAAAPPSIVAPHVTAEQGGFTDFEALQNAIYHSEFDPQQQELTREQGLADEQMKAQLAKSGLSSSGTGVGQLARQDMDFYRQMRDASANSAQKAAVQRYGMEYTQSMDNARMRQEVNLANAGFDYNSQVENAKNLLTVNITNAQMATDVSKTNAALQTQASIAGAQNQTSANIAGAQNQTSASIAGAQNQTAASIASMQAAADIAKANAANTTAASIAGAGNQTQAGIAGMQINSLQAITQAQMQLQAMGMSVEQEAAARGDYLRLLGIQETDLTRMDSFTLQNTAMMYDTYLKQLAILTQAGNVSFGKGDQSSSGMNFNVSGF